jgi:hypothetical protein
MEVEALRQLHGPDRPLEFTEQREQARSGRLGQRIFAGRGQRQVNHRTPDFTHSR